jgi:UDP-glucose 4-epimerase
MRCLVTGGAGFIGSHLAVRLAGQGHEVHVLDSLLSPHPDAASALRRAGAELQEGDLLDRAAVERAVHGCEAVFHLAANPDVRATSAAPAVAFEANVVTTHRLLEALRAAPARSVVFTSTSTVYGETPRVPTPEDLGPLEPISAYGATKLAGEALLAAHQHQTGQRCTVLRLANVTGPRATHGVVVDLVAKLRKDPQRLEILGDGTQRKSYVHVDDTVEAILAAWQSQRPGYDVFNVGSEDAIDVRGVADLCCRALGLSGVRYEFRPSAGGRGWPGDVKVMQLDVRKLRGLGWTPRHTSAQSIEAAARSAAQSSGGSS